MREGCTYSTKAERPALGHDDGRWIEDVAPTCTQEGSKHKICTRCEGTIEADVTIDKLGHDYIDHSSQASTCTEVGWNAYQTCSRCDYTTYSELQALGHTYGDLIAKVDATCSSSGYSAHYECSVCYKLFDEEKVEKTQQELIIAIDSAAHKFGSWIDEVPATLENVGIVGHKDCEYCKKHFDESDNEITEENYVIDKINGYNLIFIIDGEQVAKYYLASGTVVTYPESGSKQGFTFAWSKTIITMPDSNVTIEGVFSIDVNYFKIKVDAVQNATTVEEIYNAIVEANTALALYEGMNTQPIAGDMDRLETLVANYKQTAQNATDDVTKAVDIVSTMFGVFVEIAIAALATVISKRRLF